MTTEELQKKQRMVANMLNNLRNSVIANGTLRKKYKLKKIDEVLYEAVRDLGGISK